MNPITTQIKAAKKTALAQLERAKKNVAKTEKNLRAAAQLHQDAKGQIAKAEAEVAKYDAMLKLDGGSETQASPKVKAKPGPKPKAASAAKKTAAPTTKAAGKSRAAEGRREVLSGKRPPIKETITKVLGNRVMNAVQVYEAIKAKGQLPNSNDPKSYIGYLLSGSKITDDKGQSVSLWERVPEKGRGFYKNRGVEVTSSKKAAPAAKTAKKAAAAAPAKPKGKSPDRKNHILQLKKDNPDWTAVQIAKEAGCSTAYVYSIWGKQPAKKTAAKAAQKTAAKAAPAAKTAPKAKAASTAPAAAPKPKGKSPDRKNHILQLKKDHPDWTAVQIAKEANCSAAYVYSLWGKQSTKAKTNGAAKAKKGPTVVDHSGTNGTTAAAKPQAVTPDPEPAPAPAKAAPPAPAKSEPKTTDDILKEAGIDLSSGPLG
jgi:hypothetical protein